MRTTHLGALLLGLGVAVGTLAGVGLVLGFEPAQLPAALLNIAAYKLTFLAAFGLLAAGAVVQRHARREPRQRPASLGVDEASQLTARRASGERLADAAERSEVAVRAPDRDRRS